jgi:hypothetical protein
VREVPIHKADFYQKISKIYAAQDKPAEARRFELFAEKAADELQRLE